MFLFWDFVLIKLIWLFLCFEGALMKKWKKSDLTLAVDAMQRWFNTSAQRKTAVGNETASSQRGPAAGNETAPSA